MAGLSEKESLKNQTVPRRVFLHAPSSCAERRSWKPISFLWSLMLSAWVWRTRRSFYERAYTRSYAGIFEQTAVPDVFFVLRNCAQTSVEHTWQSRARAVRACVRYTRVHKIRLGTVKVVCTHAAVSAPTLSQQYSYVLSRQCCFFEISLYTGGLVPVTK